jgi:AcrR family transcriptional regulator
MTIRMSSSAARAVASQPARDSMEGANSRSAILNAATREFARMGLAGARIQTIADEAGVNVALLYYYFQTKEKLYAAVLEGVFSGWAQRVTAALERKGSPREKVMAYVEAYFDFVAEAPHRPRLVQQEMTQLGTGRSLSRLQVMARKYARPVYRLLLQLLQQGYEEGEFRRVSPDFVYSISGIVVSYFTSSAFIHAISGRDPLTAARIAERRRSVLDTISAALLRPAPANCQRKEEHK